MAAAGAAYREVGEFRRHIRAGPAAGSHQRCHLIQIDRDGLAVLPQLQRVVLTGGDVHVRDLFGDGMPGRQGVQPLPIQPPAAEKTEDHADVLRVVAVLRQGIALHLIDGQRFAGRAHHADGVIAVFLQRPVQHRQSGRNLKTAAGAGADRLRGCGQRPLGVQSPLGAGQYRRVDEALLQGQLHQGCHGAAVLSLCPDGRIGRPG